MDDLYVTTFVVGTSISRAESAFRIRLGGPGLVPGITLRETKAAL
jgi:hypothetical protein